MRRRDTSVTKVPGKKTLQKARRLPRWKKTGGASKRRCAPAQLIHWSTDPLVSWLHASSARGGAPAVGFRCICNCICDGNASQVSFGFRPSGKLRRLYLLKRARASRASASDPRVLLHLTFIVSLACSCATLHVACRQHAGWQIQRMAPAAPHHGERLPFGSSVQSASGCCTAVALCCSQHQPHEFPREAVSSAQPLHPQGAARSRAPRAWAANE